MSQGVQKVMSPSAAEVQRQLLDGPRYGAVRQGRSPAVEQLVMINGFGHAQVHQGGVDLRAPPGESEMDERPLDHGTMPGVAMVQGVPEGALEPALECNQSQEMVPGGHGQPSAAVPQGHSQPSTALPHGHGQPPAVVPHGHGQSSSAPCGGRGGGDPSPAQWLGMLTAGMKQLQDVGKELRRRRSSSQGSAVFQS